MQIFTCAFLTSPAWTRSISREWICAGGLAWIARTMVLINSLFHFQVVRSRPWSLFNHNCPRRRRPQSSRVSCWCAHITTEAQTDICMEHTCVGSTAAGRRGTQGLRQFMRADLITIELKFTITISRASALCGRHQMPGTNRLPCKWNLNYHGSVR